MNLMLLRLLRTWWVKICASDVVVVWQWVVVAVRLISRC